MTDGTLRANIQMMRDGAQKITASSRVIQTAVQNASSEINALGPDRFSSPAAEAFRAAYRGRTDYLNHFSEELVGVAKNLESAADDIEAAAQAAGS
jgi:uncharacterized protein YukE